MNTPGNILIVDDDLSLIESLTGLLEHAGHTVRSAGTSTDALAAVGSCPTDLVLLDLRLGSEHGLDLLPRLKTLRPEMSVIMITALGTVENAVEAMRLGADNFIIKPLDPPQLLAILAKGFEARELRHRSSRLERLSGDGAREIVTASPAMEQALNMIDTVADRDTTVLLLGETGTGKGMMARRIHHASPRREQPFVELNCAGLQPELTESELFGHERGAFTGAADRKLGLFEAAHHGTLFLDEIGEMDPAVQAKLLHVLEEQHFRRLGGVTEIEADVRVLVATHRNLEALASRGEFRRDLYYRLNVFAVPIPPLRERPEDILLLALRFLSEYRGGDGNSAGLSDDAAAVLQSYRWPGNVRELRNVMERAAILCPADAAIQSSHLPPLPAGGSPPQQQARSTITMDDAEQKVLEQALQAHDGNIQAAARQLGVSRGTLYRKIKKFGL